MAKDIESTMQWKLDISQFKANIKDAKREITLANAEFKKSTAGSKTWANSITGLEAKLRQLTTQERAQKTILQELKNQYSLIVQEMGEASPEAKRLETAIARQEAAIAKTEREINEYGQQLSQLEAEEEQASSAFGRLTAEIEQQEQELQQLKQAYANAKLDGNAEEAERLAREIEKLSEELMQNKRAMNEAEHEADQFDRSLDDLGNSAGRAEKGFTVFRGMLANLASDVIMRAVEGLKELARQTLEVGMAFDTSMAKVGAISGATGAELDALREKAKELGATTVFSATEAADAMTYMAMAGWKTEDILDGLGGVMSLAAASGEDLAKTSDIVTDALTAFGLSAADSGHFADILAAASSNANTNVSLMGETFKYCAPIAGALGFSAEDTAEAIGLMANAGIKGSQAGTALRTIMNNLSNDVTITGSALGQVTIATTNADGSMRDLSDILTDCRSAFSQLTEAEQAQAAEALVGKNAMSGFLALMNAAPGDIDKLSSALENCDGAAQKMAETMQDNLGGDVTKMKSNLESLQLQLYEKLEPALRAGVEALNGLIDAISFVVDHSTAFLTVLSALTAGITAFVLAVKGAAILSWLAGIIEMVTGGFAALGAVMLANPIGLIIAGIAALVAAFVVLWNKCEAFRNFWKSVWDGIRFVFESWVNIIKKLLHGDIEGAFKDYVKLMETVRDAVKKVLEIIIKAVIDWAKKMIDKAKEAGKNFAEGLLNFIKSIPGKVLAYLTEVITNLAKFASDMLAKGKEAGSQLVSGVVSGLADLVGKVKSKVGEVISALASFVKDMAAKGKEAANALINAIINAFSGIASKFYNVGKGIIDGVISGINANAYRVGQLLGNYAAQWVQSTMARLGINSPSKVFADKVGRAIPEGIAYGVELEMPRATKQMQNALGQMVDDLKIDATGALSGLTSGSMSNINVASAGNGKDNSKTINFYQTIESPKAVDRLTIYRDTNSLLFGAKVRLQNV